MEVIPNRYITDTEPIIEYFRIAQHLHLHSNHKIQSGIAPYLSLLFQRLKFKETLDFLTVALPSDRPLPTSYIPHPLPIFSYILPIHFMLRVHRTPHAALQNCSLQRCGVGVGYLRHKHFKEQALAWGKESSEQVEG
jgi:hypothetical protein